MSLLARLRSLFGALTARSNFESGMSEELRFHMEEFADDLVRSGVPRVEAVRRARIEFGGVNTVMGECRQARGLQVLDECSRQVRYAVRLLRKSPGFTLTALVTLGLCMGANLAIFSVVDSILVRPLPFPAADRLVTIYNTYPKAGVERDGASLTNYYERRGRITALSSISIYRLGTAIVGEAGSSSREQVTQVSPEFFATLGAAPAMGRVFNEQETSYQTDRVAIVSDAYWHEAFNADPHILGRQVRVDSFPKTIVGVLPAGFQFLSSRARLYVPLSSRPEDHAPAGRHSGGNFTQMIGRLKPGATLKQAQAQIDAQNDALEVDDPQGKLMADAGFRSVVTPLHADHVASIRPTLLLLQAGAIFLLLIGAVNLINLLLIRAGGRVKELGVRQALGATRGFVISEVVTETTVLTVAGGLLGVLAGAGGIRLLVLLGADRLPLGAAVAFNARLAFAALAASLVIGTVLAVPLAWFNLRRQLGNSIQSEGRGGTTGRASQKLRHGFIVAQIALAFILMAGAGLLGLSLQRAMAVWPGFRADHVLTGQVSLVGKKYPTPLAGLEFIERLVNDLDNQPGVISAGIVNNLPFSGITGKSAANVIGHVLRPGEAPRGNYSYGVGGDYFQAMGFTLQAGRFLTSADSRRTVRVCVVDEDFARYYWPKDNPLGHRLFQGSEAGPDAEAFTVVGVVGHVKQAGLTEEAGQGAIYYPFIYRPDNHMFAVVRGRKELAPLGLTLRNTVRQIDPELPVNDLRSMDARIADSLVARRSSALLAGTFSAIALLLTAIGTYGVLSFAVAQRRREIGVRMALGARPEQIRAQFFSIALRLLVCGTVVGAGGVWVAGKGLQAVLFHVAAFSAIALGGTSLLMTGVCLAACLIPACRAARISPVEAIAAE